MDALQHARDDAPRVARVFICYRRVEPDQSVARALDEALTAAGHEVFVDLKMKVGTPWAQRIEEELQRAEVLIALLSEQSVRSEMTIGEIGTAHRLRTRLLPVRLAYREPFLYPVSAWLNPINWAYWDGPAGTPALIEEVLGALKGEALPISDGARRPEFAVRAEEANRLPPPQPIASLEPQSGTMDVDSPLYIRRATDDVALAAVGRKGQTLSIKGARQMGKSSLLMRLLDAAAKGGKRVAFVDFQEIDIPTLRDADLFFRRFCANLSDQLGLANRTAEYWDPALELGNPQRCSKYMGEHVLKSLAAPLLLALDEVDRLVDSPFRSDFFGMVRSWHGKRALPTVPVWKLLDVALVTSTEPNLLIDDPHQSPFNVGERVELADFTPGEVARLNQLHGSPVKPEREPSFVALTGGQPYLTRQALYLVASGRASLDALSSQGDLDGGPFGDHLRHLLFLVSKRNELVTGLREVLLQGTCSDPIALHRLRSAGLVKPEGGKLVMRCDLYAAYFRKHLVG